MAGVGPLDREGGPGSRKALTSAAEELSGYRTAMTLAGANPEAWALINRSCVLLQGRRTSGVWLINELGYCNEFARAVVPARVKLKLTSMIRCISESVGANVHFFDAWMASRSK